MHTKSTTIALAFALALAPQLAGCGGSASSASSASSSAAEAQLTPEQIMDAAFAASPVAIDDAFDISVSAVDDDGMVTVSFSTKHGAFAYTIDAVTGEVLARVEPTDALEQSAQNPLEKDAVGLATAACIDAYVKEGVPENIQSKARTDDGVQKVRVQYDYKGTHYDLDYDVATGKITEYSADAEASADVKEAADEKADAEAAARAAAEAATEGGTKQLDPNTAADMALQAAFSIYDKEGKSENISTSYSDENPGVVEVEFDLEGEHYDLMYDVATGVFTRL